MAEFGWTVPVLASAEGEVIAGHGRILAAAELGLSNVPIIVLEHLSEARRRAYRIADNKFDGVGRLGQCPAVRGTPGAQRRRL
jgi:ParB-like chromosome segregation protein Spo0J